MPCFYLFENISSFISFSFVYRFVCDLDSLLGYTQEDLHRLGNLQPSDKKEDETTDAEDARITEAKSAAKVFNEDGTDGKDARSKGPKPTGDTDNALIEV